MCYLLAASKYIIEGSLSSFCQMYRIYILGTVCLLSLIIYGLYKLYWGQCVCTGYTGDSVFVQDVLGIVCLYRLYWGQCVCTGCTGNSVFVQVVLCLYRL